MHTTKMMSTNDFNVEINGQKSSIDDLFPGFHEHDRLGIVVRRPGGSAGASALLLAAITRFYDFHRPRLGNDPGKLRIYPEYFIFHIGKSHLDHYWMDVWTPNKEVIVEDDPEQILEAINDRSITRLLVEDIDPSPATFLDETISSASHRIKSALAYTATGRVQNADVSITSCTAAERLLTASFNRSENLSEHTKMQLLQGRKALAMNGSVMETYRRIEIKDALCMLTPAVSPGLTTRSYLSML